ncbi:MAG: rhomboid family intramembrane serine protease [Defluviitaleaceae bacterium]|nr:rhomboid family intramembrane serine protease [Defluviitaleaceae bacterium]
MFSQFSARLYKIVASGGYRLSATNNEILHATHWVAENVEMATLVTIHAVDAEKIGIGEMLEYDAKLRAKSELLLGRVASVTNVYVFAGGDVPDFSGTEEYIGQPIYSIFWHINLETGEITTAPGQPKKIFDIHKMVMNAADDAGGAPVNAPENFADITINADTYLPKVKHRIPIFSYSLIFINFIILVITSLRPDILALGAINPVSVVNDNEWYRLFTAMFLHIGFFHFFANSFGIVIFATRLERYLGRGFFLFTYVLSGLIGSMLSLANFYFFHPIYPASSSVGASGAVFGMYGAIYAYTRITKHSLDFINSYFLLIFIGISLVMGFATPGIDNFAHVGGLLGGMIIGGIYAILLKKHAKRALDTEDIRR